MHIEIKLKEIIVTIKSNGIDICSINNKTNLTTDLGFDSLEIVELIVELENEFNIEFDDDDLDIENITVFHKLLETIEIKTTQLIIQ